MTTFNVPNMSCGHCIKSITEALQAVDADARIETNLATKNVSIDSKASSVLLVHALTEAGYPPSKQ